MAIAQWLVGLGADPMAKDTVSDIISLCAVCLHYEYADICTYRLSFFLQHICIPTTVYSVYIYYGVSVPLGLSVCASVPCLCIGSILACSKARAADGVLIVYVSVYLSIYLSIYLNISICSNVCVYI